MKETFLDNSICNALNNMQIKYNRSGSAILFESYNARIHFHKIYFNKLIVALSFKKMDEKLIKDIIDKIKFDGSNFIIKDKECLFYAFINFLLGSLTIALGFFISDF